VSGGQFRAENKVYWRPVWANLDPNPPRAANHSRLCEKAKGIREAKSPSNLGPRRYHDHTPLIAYRRRRIFFAIQAFQAAADLLQSDELAEGRRGLFVIFHKPC
jgi:hypothetical protein